MFLLYILKQLDLIQHKLKRQERGPASSFRDCTDHKSSWKQKNQVDWISEVNSINLSEGQGVYWLMLYNMMITVFSKMSLLRSDALKDFLDSV